MDFSAVFDSYWYWFSAALLLLVLEVLIPGAFLMWIGLGAVGVGLFLWIFPSATLALQLVALAISVTVAVVAGVHWQKRTRHTPNIPLNQGLDSYLGRSAIASQDFHQGQGRIRLDDSFFTAHSPYAIEHGQQVKIIAVDEAGFAVVPQS